MTTDDTCSAFVYRIAPDDTIVFVDQAWITFDGSLLSQLTHGICPTCSEALHKRLEGLREPG